MLSITLEINGLGWYHAVICAEFGVKSAYLRQYTMRYAFFLAWGCTRKQASTYTIYQEIFEGPILMVFMDDRLTTKIKLVK